MNKQCNCGGQHFVGIVSDSVCEGRKIMMLNMDARDLNRTTWPREDTKGEPSCVCGVYCIGKKVVCGK